MECSIAVLDAVMAFREFRHINSDFIGPEISIKVACPDPTWNSRSESFPSLSTSKL